MIDYLILHEVRVGSQRFMNGSFTHTVSSPPRYVKRFVTLVVPAKKSPCPNVVTLRTVPNTGL